MLRRIIQGWKISRYFRKKSKISKISDIFDIYPIFSIVMIKNKNLLAVILSAVVYCYYTDITDICYFFRIYQPSTSAASSDWVFVTLGPLRCD